MTSKLLDRIYLVYAWALFLEATVSVFHGLWVMIFHSQIQYISNLGQAISGLLLLFSIMTLICSAFYQSRRSYLIFALSLMIITEPFFSSPFIFKIVEQVSMFEFLTGISNFSFLMTHGNSYQVFFFALNFSVVLISALALLLMRHDSERFFTQTFYLHSFKRWAVAGGLFSIVFLGSLAAYVIGPFVTLQQAIGLNISQGNLVCMERSFTKDGKTIVLLPMAHMADASFYQGIIRDFQDKEAVFLVEGVKDATGLIKGKLFYENLAKTMGIASQSHALQFPKETKIKFVWADVDISEFNKKTVEFINLLSVSKDSDKNLSLANFAEINRMIKQEGMMDIIFGDILNLRNARLLSRLHEQLPQSKFIVIAWGAAHMHDLELQLTKNGFQKSTESQRTLTGLSTLLNRTPASAVE